ncbi:hypothetical protein BKA65DRAFT_465562 [Rhexocercosporidium sp. MPI-PUGE-AT-0058]|nr:hypothetical protein BKA65DRAFT_465562 [Rhexocercosporidium sp. MPI-PUGE-AT-0058]
MKIILTGSTGTIGTEVLTQSINNPSLTEIVILSRRPLPPTHPTSPKIKTIVISDFLSYPAQVLKELSGAEACIWALGGIPSRFPDLATARMVNIDYPLAAAKAFTETVAPGLGEGKKFRFLYVSGHAVDRDLSKQHRFFNDGIHIKACLPLPFIFRRGCGEIENKLVQLEADNADKLSVYLPRPGSVIPPNNKLITVLVKLTTSFYPAMKGEEFAAAMIDVAIRGADEQTLSHDVMQQKGRKALSAE